jgi:hypothetical protein
LSASPTSKVVHDEDRYEDGEDDSVGDEAGIDENDDQYEVAGKPTFARPVDDIHCEEDEEEERPENIRVTRFRGEKHVPVYKSEMVTNQQLSALPNKTRSFQTVRKSIIHCDNYSRMHNFEVKYFRAESKDIFYARKRALLAHAVICKESFCELCQLNKKVQTFKYMASNLARYNDTIESTAKPSRSKKQVQFIENTKHDIVGNKLHLHLTLTSLFRACEHNISFKELALLTTN